MSHWLEEAEKNVAKHKDKKQEINDRIDTKKADVKANRDLIEKEFLAVIDQLETIIDRINNLPRKHRIPFGQIYSKPKESKLENLLHKFNSSRRLASREFKNMTNPMSMQHYKNTRSFFISIARNPREILLEYKDIRVKRVRLNDHAKSFFDKFSLFKLFSKKKELHEVKENIITMNIDQFNEDMVLKHIDWLAYKYDGNLFFQD
jgi:hypothetical protein